MKLIVIPICHADVEACDISSTLARLHSLPIDPQGLRDLMGSVCFTVSGYDHIPDELQTIPAVRTFYKALDAAWPFILYFGNIETECLQIFTFCLLDDIAVMTRSSGEKSGVSYDKATLFKFFKTHTAPMCHLLGTAYPNDPGAAQVASRTTAICEAFSLIKST